MLRALFFFLLPAAVFCKVNGKGDFQIWNSNGLDLSLSKNVHFLGNVEFRYGNNGKKLYYKYYQGGFKWQCSSHILLHLAYRYAYYRIKEKWATEHNPLLDFILQFGNRKGLFIANRNRIQYRVLEKPLGGKNRWVYRNYLELIPPYRFSKKKFASFIANEFFWQEARGIDQNQTEVGLIIPYHQRTGLRLSYMVRVLKTPSKKWIHHNILKLNFSLYF